MLLVGIRSLLVVLVGAVALAGLTTWLTARIRRYALARDIQDVPNERSSHSVATPRGGGASVVLTTLAGATLVLALSEFEDQWLVALLVGGSIIALTGWMDDIRSLRARTRLILQFVAAGGSLALVYHELVIGLPATHFLVGFAAFGIGVFHIVWGINSYNFMDGIDGLAASQAVTVGLAVAIIAYVSEHHQLALVSLIVASSGGGFLVLNWQPAKIFMGDVCSGFLGFLIAFSGLWGESSGAVPLPAVLILMGVFVVDSTYTLLRRLVAGERVYQAHRDHAYQHAVQRGHSHAQVSAAIIAINLAWLVPLGALATIRPNWAWLLLALAYLPLSIAVAYFRAGERLS